MFQSFPKIRQYRNILRDLNHGGHQSMTFRGTVKLHGTNAAIGFNGETQEVFYQSRNRILTPFDDNMGFARWATDNVDAGSVLGSLTSVTRPVVIMYGEWCGQGVQRGVGISNLSKMFVVFAVAVTSANGEDRVWYDPADLDLGPMDKITNYPTYEVTVDISTPSAVIPTMTELVEAVEESCPVAVAKGESGIGEGIVWAPVVEGQVLSSRYWFKTKGEKHSKSKVKRLPTVDPEKVASNTEFTNMVVNEERLEQGLAYLQENGLALDRTSTGKFLKWMNEDIVAEEMDLIEANGITKADMGRLVMTPARNWFFAKLDQLVGI